MIRVGTNKAWGSSTGWLHIAKRAGVPGVPAGHVFPWGGFVEHIATGPRGVFELVELFPRRTAHLAVATRSLVFAPATMAMRLIRACVIFTLPHAFRAEDVVDMHPWMCTGPALYHIIHVPVKFAMVVPERRMMEDTIDIVKDLVHWHFGMLPGIDDPRSDILKNCRCDLACRFIQNIGKVVFREKRMGGIRAMWVSPGLILVFAAGIDHARTTGFQLRRYGIDDGADERREQRKYEYRQGFGDFLHQRF